jgi:hypothetical protein
MTSKYIINTVVFIDNQLWYLIACCCFTQVIEIIDNWFNSLCLHWSPVIYDWLLRVDIELKERLSCWYPRPYQPVLLRPNLLKEEGHLNQHSRFHDRDGILCLSYSIQSTWVRYMDCKTICLQFIKWGIRHTSTALYFYGASKKSLHKSRTTYGNILFHITYAFNYYLQLFCLQFLSKMHLNL